MSEDKREKLKKYARLLGNALLLVIVFVGASAFQTRNMLSTSLDVPAPSLSGPLLRGGSFDVAASPDRPVLVYFFAPWCTVCALSSDNLVRLRRLRDEDSLSIIAVALDWQTRSEVQEYVERHDLELPVVLGDRQLVSDWQITAFPTYYVLDGQRLIRRRDLGYSSQFGLWWRTFFVG